MGCKAVTGNRLDDGRVVYLTKDGEWSGRLSECRLAATDAEGASLLALAERDAAGGRVVGPYLFEVGLDGGAVTPLGQRETIRARLG